MKTMMIAGGLVGAALVLSGCGLKSVGGPTNQETKNYQVTEKIAALQLKSGSGDTVISEYSGTAVRVTETLQWRDDKPKAQHSVNGDTLFVTYDCPGNFLGSCSVDYKIEVPKGLKLDVDSGSGDLTLRAVSGDLTLSNGSGEIQGSGLIGKRVYAKAGSGNIELKYASAPDSAEFNAGSGDVTLMVPQGSYAISSKVGSGDKNISVPNDPSSPHKVSFEVGSGDANMSFG
ncbi:MAG: DUF4097 family beta strand repeat protein [Nonomuraea sp.]|nr:DUF4097 family beta strand repeat protein [Nonomuraea sp.]